MTHEKPYIRRVQTPNNNGITFSILGNSYDGANFWVTLTKKWKWPKLYRYQYVKAHWGFQFGPIDIIKWKVV
jgi:hypothetical protein